MLAAAHGSLCACFDVVAAYADPGVIGRENGACMPEPKTRGDVRRRSRSRHAAVTGQRKRPVAGAAEARPHVCADEEGNPRLARFVQYRFIATASSLLSRRRDHAWKRGDRKVEQVLELGCVSRAVRELAGGRKSPGAFSSSHSRAYVGTNFDAAGSTMTGWLGHLRRASSQPTSSEMAAVPTSASHSGIVTTGTITRIDVCLVFPAMNAMTAAASTRIRMRRTEGRLLRKEPRAPGPPCAPRSARSRACVIPLT